MAWSDRIFRIDKGKQIVGTTLHAFIHNGDYYLTEIKIYADGMIDCWGLVDLATFKQKVEEGWVVVQVPDGASVCVSLLSQFKVANVSNWKTPENFVAEVLDEIEELNGRPTTSDRCRAAFVEYQKSPSAENLQRLKDAYESIPEHNRRYVLRDQDAKDLEIRRILYGDQ